MSEDKVLKEMTTEDMVDDHNVLVDAYARLADRHIALTEQYLTLQDMLSALLLDYNSFILKINKQLGAP